MPYYALIAETASAAGSTERFIAISLVLLFLTCGLIGGYAGYLLDPSSSSVEPDSATHLLRKSLILGVVGAFLVPLYLSVTSATAGADSGLIENLKTGKIAPWFVLISLALLAAVSSQRLISNLSSKLFDDIKRKQEEIEEKAEAAHDRLEGAEDDIQTMAKKSAPAVVSEAPKLSPMVTNALKALQPIAQSWQTRGQIQSTLSSEIEGIASDDDVSDLLSDLERKGLLRTSGRGANVRCRISAKGTALGEALLTNRSQ